MSTSTEDALRAELTAAKQHAAQLEADLKPETEESEKWFKEGKRVNKALRRYFQSQNKRAAKQDAEFLTMKGDHKAKLVEEEEELRRQPRRARQLERVEDAYEAKLAENDKQLAILRRDLREAYDI